MDYPREELRDIIISTMVLGFAFTVLYVNDLAGLNLLLYIPVTFIVGLSFVGHELMHRTFARYFGATAHYRMWPFGLLLAVVTSFMGYLFAAPGAVEISPSRARWAGDHLHMGKREIGIIALSGPAANMALVAAFTLLFRLTGVGWFAFGALMNSLLAAFNLLPVPPLDGGKVLTWDVKVWLMALLTSGAAYFMLR